MQRNVCGTGSVIRRLEDRVGIEETETFQSQISGRDGGRSGQVDEVDSCGPVLSDRRRCQRGNRLLMPSSPLSTAAATTVDDDASSMPATSSLIAGPAAVRTPWRALKLRHPLCANFTGQLRTNDLLLS